MTKLFAIAIPVLPGKSAQLEKFMAELTNGKGNDFLKSRENLNVRERTFLQKSPQGDMVIVTLEGENPEVAFTKFGAGTDEFTKWFTAQVKELHGIDLANPPQGALPKLMVDSHAIAHA